MVNPFLLQPWKAAFTGPAFALCLEGEALVGISKLLQQWQGARWTGPAICPWRKNFEPWRRGRRRNGGARDSLIRTLSIRVIRARSVRNGGPWSLILPRQEAIT